MLPADAWRVSSQAFFASWSDLSSLHKRGSRPRDATDSGNWDYERPSLAALIPSFIQEADGGFVDKLQLHAVMEHAPKATQTTRKVGRRETTRGHL